VSNWLSSDSPITGPGLGSAWRDEHGIAHATVRLGASVMSFDDPDVARAVAAACAEAAEAIEGLPPAREAGAGR
jgi:hypothetical protein